MSNLIKRVLVGTILMALGAAAAAQSNHTPPAAAAEQAAPADRLMLGARAIPPEILERLAAGRAEHERLAAMLPEEVRNRPIVPCTQQTDQVLRSGATTVPSRRWLEKTVPYDFDASVGAAERALAINAMATIASISRVAFVPRNGHAAYIRFYDSDRNSAGIGAPIASICDLGNPGNGLLDVGEQWRQSGENPVNMYNWSSSGVLLHEILHTLGFWHTQSRRDRDQHVRINWDNIDNPAQYEHNFYVNDNSSLILPYDFDSLMHYDGCAFSDCPFCPACLFDPDGDDGKTIITLNPDNQSRIGQRDGLSTGDIMGLWAHYGYQNSSITYGVPELSELLAPGQSQPRSLYGTPATFVPISQSVGMPFSPDEYYRSAAWFRVVGNGGTFRATLSAAGNGIAGLAVHRLPPSPACGLPQNLAAIAERVTGGGLYAAWRTTPDEVYLIAVRGLEIVPIVTQDAAFIISLEDLGTAGNDNCDNAEPLSVTIPGLTGVQPPVSGDLTAATNDGGTDCAAQIDITTPRSDVWYRYDVPFTGQLNLLIDTTSEGPNTILSVHSGCPGTAANQLACNASRAIFQEDAEITMNVVAGQTLFVRVSWEFTFGAANSGRRDGTFELSSTLTVSPPANSNCSSAATLVPGTPLNQNMLGAAATGSASCAGFPNAVYYQYTAPAAATLRLSATPLNGSLPPYLSIHSPTCPATTATQLACGYGQVSAALAAGQTVRIRAAGTWNTQFTLNSTFAPDNDACEDAVQTFADSTVQGTLLAATADGQQNCAPSPNGDVWYRFTAPADGTLIADTYGTWAAGGPDTVLSAYEGCPATNDNILDCNDDSGSLDSRIDISMTQGQEVRIRVGYYDDTIGSGEFSLRTSFVNVVQFARLDPSPTAEQAVRFKADFGAPVSGLDALDLSTTQTGTLSSTAVSRIAPSAGMRFDGSPASKISTAANPAFNLRNNFTIEAWVRPQSAAAYGLIFSTRSSNNNVGVRLAMLPGGGLQFTLFGVQNIDAPMPRIGTGQWSHVAVTRTGSEVRFYVNGALVQTVTPGSADALGSAQGAVIGGDFFSESWNGLLDEVRVWNTPRTTAEIAANMYTRLLGYETGLIGYWKLDTFEDLGVGAAGVNDVRDSSPTAVHGHAGAVDLADGRPAGPHLGFKRASNSRIVVPNDAAYSLPNTFTVEARVRANDLPNGTTRHAFFGADNNVAPAGGIQVGRETNGSLIFTAFGVADMPIAVQPFTPGQWVHIAVSVDASRVVRYYVDGALIGSPTLAANVRPWVSPLYIGRSGSAAYWDGDIDEVRYWSVVRSTAEILANKDRQLVGTETGLIGHWTLNALEDLGIGNAGRNDCLDSSPLGNHGDAVNVFEGPVSDYFITVDTGMGSGELGLDLLPGATLTDSAGLPRFLVGDVTETYIIDRPNLCPADFDGNGTVAVPDIFAFLSAWFAQGLGSDFDDNGTVGVPDIFAFLSAWFAGCSY